MNRGEPRRSKQHERKLIAAMPRDDLEDAYMRLHEQELELRRKLKESETALKLKTTELAREKALSTKALGPGRGQVRSAMELQLKLEAAEEENAKAEVQIESLKRKLRLARQELQENARSTRAKQPYSHVTSRISTNIRRESAVSSRRASQAPGPSAPARRPQTQDQAVVEELRAKIEQLDAQLKRSEDLRTELDQEIDALNEELEHRDTEVEELMRFKAEHESAGLDGNVEIVRLRRELKQAQNELLVAKAEAEEHQNELKALKANHEQVLAQLKDQHDQLTSATSAAEYQREALPVRSSPDRRALADKDMTIQQLREECRVLKEAKQKLLETALSSDHQKASHAKQQQLNGQIQQLQEQVRSLVAERADAMENLASESAENTRNMETIRDLRRQVYKLKEDNEHLNNRLQFFDKHSRVPPSQLEAALTLVQQQQGEEAEKQRLDGILGPEPSPNDVEAELKALRAAHHEALQKLEQTRSLLSVEHEISKDYKLKADKLEDEVGRLTGFRDKELTELARIADERQETIRRLRERLREIAYGTDAAKGPVAIGADYSSGALPAFSTQQGEAEEDHLLRKGQNRISLEFSHAEVTPEARVLLDSDQPAFMLTWQFFDFEMEGSDVRVGLCPRFEARSQHVVDVNDLLFDYLANGTMSVELHRVVAGDAVTVAAAQVKLRPLVQHQNVHGSKTRPRFVQAVDLISLQQPELKFATVFFTFFFEMPMERALQLFRRRAKASEALRQESRGSAAADEGSPCTLEVSVLKCEDLAPYLDNITSSMVAFSFGDSQRFVTAAVKGTRHPQFDFTTTFDLIVSQRTLANLKKDSLTFLVLEVDADGTTVVRTIAQADVSLAPLARGEAVQGCFPLRPVASSQSQPGTTAAGSPTSHDDAGLLYVQLRWGEAPTSLLQGQLADEVPRYNESSEARPAVRKHVRARAGSDVSAAEARQPSSGWPREDLGLLADRPKMESEALVAQKNVAATIPEDNAAVASGGTEKSDASEAADAATAGTKNWSSSTASREEEPPEEQPASDNTHLQPRRQVGRVAASSAAADEAFDQGPASAELEHNPSASAPPQQHEDVSPVDAAQRSSTRNLQVEQSTVSDFGHSGRTDASSMVTTGQLASSLDSETAKYVVPITDSSSQQSGKKMAKKDPTGAPPITITVAKLSLDDQSILSNPSIHHLFISYRFLHVPEARLETPLSLPKPSAGKFASFDFSLKFVFTGEDDQGGNVVAGADLPKELKRLAKAVKKTGKALTFEVISEPDEDDEAAECETIGVAGVDLRQLLGQGRDLVNQPLDVLHPGDGRVIGLLFVTVEVIDALKYLLKKKHSS